MTQATQPIFGVRPRGLVLLLLILILAAVVRLWNIGQRSLWLDEFLTVGGSNSRIYSQFDLPRGQVVEPVPDYISLSAAPPWYQIWTRASGEVHPPLFYLTLRIWRDFVPDTDSRLRALSTVFALVSIVMLYICVKTQAGEAPALWASLLMALAGPQIDYSQEIRSYTMTLACLLTACAGLILIEKRGFNWPRGLLLGIGVLLAGLTHYLAMPVLAVLALYALIRLRGIDRKRTLLTFVAAGFVFCCLWGPFALQQRHGFLGKTWFTKVENFSVLTWLSQIADLPARFFVSVPIPTPQGFPRWIFLAGVLFYIIPPFFLRRNPALLIWWMILALGMSVDALGDLVRRAKMLDIIRYTLAFSPGAYAIGGLLLANWSGWRRHIVPAALSVICLLTVPLAYGRFKADWRGLGEFIKANFSAQDILVMNDPVDPREPETLDWRIRADYLSMNYYMRSGFPAMVFLTTAPNDDVRRRIDQARTVWFFTSYDAEKINSILPAARFMPALLVDRAGQLEKVELRPAASTPPAEGQ